MEQPVTMSGRMPAFSNSSITPICDHPRAAEEADEIGRHDKGHLEGGKTLELAAHAQKGALKTIADHQKADTQK